MNRTDRPARCAAVHDLSGLGRCSLSVILPAMSVMGVQVCPLPTAVLSTHTGGFGTPARRDLTDYLTEALAHYRTLGLPMECVYTGYLGSVAQVALCQGLFAEWPAAMKVVDPVMGDHGKLYHGFTPELVQGIRELATHADVITPNLTEACMLLKIPPVAEGLSRSQAKSLLVRLSELGPNYVVITGAPMVSGQIANIGYDRQHNSFWCILCDYVPVSYPGTGDLFASVLTGGFLTGDSLPMAMGRASYFVERCIKTTFSYSSDTRYGVMLEKELGALIDRQNVKDFSLL